MDRSALTNRILAAIVAPAVVAAALAMPAAGKKNDPANPADTAATAPADAGAGDVSEPVPPEAPPPGVPPTATPAGVPGMPAIPGFGEPAEVGGIIEPDRLVRLVEECDSIAVAGFAVAAHNCANGVDVVGTLPPGAPWTVFTASKDTYTMAAPKAMSGKRSEIELPFSAEPLRRWVREETGVRLRRER